ncbi:hypothetical protein GOP47_0018092 [Adiantum capillus-veneris]|uniref:Uncharacterized protein n=1 Tax=Adiantum capillus-veneris TaxID=13818 RepID=A0A9D4UGN5_ADICA|nr:hypothetical protein GOP47_0018092 [Adiantum capillus-veneris]
MFKKCLRIFMVVPEVQVQRSCWIFARQFVQVVYVISMPQTEDQVVARGQNDGGYSIEVEEDDDDCESNAHHLGFKAARRDNLARVGYIQHRLYRLETWLLVGPVDDETSMPWLQGRCSVAHSRRFPFFKCKSAPV